MAVKTLEDINLAYNASRAGRFDDCRTARSTSRAGRFDSNRAAQNPKTSPLGIASDVIFYLAIAVILYSVMSIDLSEGSPRSVLGFSSFVVMSESMEDEMPKGSLIIIRDTDPNKLSVGDIITFSRSSGITVTHKIIDIIDAEAAQGGRGERRFQTKGTSNASPDSYTVAQSDVLGKVVFVLPRAGAYVDSINENIHIILIIFVLCSLLSFLLKGVSRHSNNRRGAAIDYPVFSK